MKLKTLALLVAIGSTLCIAGKVYSHGNVLPQGADSSAMPDIEGGDEDEDGWVFENPYRNTDGDVKEKIIKFGESAYANNCAGCHGLHAQSGGINPDLRTLDPESFEDDEWFVERLRFGSAKGMPALGGIPEGQSEPILDQKTLWSIKTYVEQRRVVAIEEGEIDSY
ncbi:MAG: cytochrome c-550 PedF [Pseudomonadota bacterium]